MGRLHQAWAPRVQPGRPPPPGSPRQGAAWRGRRPSQQLHAEFPPLVWGSDPSLSHLGQVHPSALREGDFRGRAHTEAVHLSPEGAQGNPGCSPPWEEQHLRRRDKQEGRAASHPALGWGKPGRARLLVHHPLRKIDFPVPSAKRSGGWDTRQGACPPLLTAPEEATH